jgi:fructose-bisphosphate aldolase class II
MSLRWPSSGWRPQYLRGSPLIQWGPRQLELGKTPSCWAVQGARLLVMPIATVDEYGELLDAASAGGYALAAVNVTSSETLNAAVRGFAEADSDGIVEVTTGAAAYLSGAAGDAETGARALALFARETARRYRIRVALHTDHCPPDQVDSFVRPLLRQSARRQAAGEEPLFQSHMFDGSTLRLEENLRISLRLLEECDRLGVALEVECGVVGGTEDDVSGEGVASRRLYTTPADLLHVAEVLGTGERGRYLLAATFGNVHGLYGPGEVELRPGILRKGQEALARAHPGARFQYVFHGSSGSTDAQVREAIANGVVKINLDSELQYAFTGAVRNYLDERDPPAPDRAPAKSDYDPRAWGKAAEKAMASTVAERCELFGSAGRTLW